jgi:hypothetical protein
VTRPRNPTLTPKKGGSSGKASANGKRLRGGGQLGSVRREIAADLMNRFPKNRWPEPRIFDQS